MEKSLSLLLAVETCEPAGAMAAALLALQKNIQRRARATSFGNGKLLALAAAALLRFKPRPLQRSRVRLPNRSRVFARKLPGRLDTCIATKTHLQSTSMLFSQQ